MKRLVLDKIASVTSRLELGARVCIDSRAIVAQEGYVVAVRALDEKQVYNKLEDPHGRLVRVYKGDVFAGVLGQRRALLGHDGVVPESIACGDTLHLLNMGGVIGLCTSSNRAVGPALRCEVLGAVLSFPVIESRQGVPAHLGQTALKPVDELAPAGGPPLVIVSGTCMNSGKTAAASVIVRALAQAGLEVAAAKLTGVATKRDLMAMQDCGARQALSFCDAGLPSTQRGNAPQAARAVLAALAASRPAPQVIVVELGDGLLGEYGVLEILTAADIAAQPAVHVCCASDPVGAFGAAQIFRQHLDLLPDVLTGPATDNAVGCRAISQQLGLTALNALQEPERLGKVVLAGLQACGLKQPEPWSDEPAEEHYVS